MAGSHLTNLVQLPYLQWLERTIVRRSHSQEQKDICGIMTMGPDADLLHQLEHRMAGLQREPLRASEWPVPDAASAWLPLVDISKSPTSSVGGGGTRSEARE